MRILTLLMITIACMGFSLSVAAQDVIAERVKKAESNYQQSTHRGLAILGTVLERKIDTAKRSGNLELLTVLQEQKRLFTEEQILPTHVSLTSDSKRYGDLLEREAKALIRYYNVAVKDYTKAGDLEAAKRMQDKIAKAGPVPRLVIGKSQASSIPRRGEKEFADGNLREVWGDRKGNWIDLSIVDDRLQESMLSSAGHVQYQNGKIREAWGKKRAQWIDLTIVSEKMQESTLPSRKQHLQYQNGKLREKFGKQHGPWITIRELAYEPIVFEIDLVQTLKSATTDHNKRIVTQRKELQSAILQANTEEAIGRAKDNYRHQVVRIKDKYINALQAALEDAIAKDRLIEAGQIKVQILRVKSQIESLATEDNTPDVPALDAGDGSDTSAPPQLNDQAPPEQSDIERDESPQEDKPGPDGAGNFFGLPLE